MDMNKEIPGTVLPEEFATPIGYFAIWFSVLEVNLDALIAWLLKARGNGTEIVLSHIESVDRRLRAMESLANDYLGDTLWRDEMAHLVLEVRRLNESRNSLLHGRWFAYSPTKKTASKYRSRAKKTLHRPVCTWSADQIMTEGFKCLQTAGRLQRFRADLGGGVLYFGGL